MWDQDAQRWFYYDMNMNGYAADANGRTLSIAALRSNLLTGENLHLEASLTVGDFTKEEFEQAVRDFPIEWYVLSNHSLNKEPGRRFGKLNRFHTWFERLPNPIDRVLDNLTGDRDRRLIVAGRVQIAGLTSLQGGRVLVGYLVLICLVSGVILFTQRRSSSRWSV